MEGPAWSQSIVGRGERGGGCSMGDEDERGARTRASTTTSRSRGAHLARGYDLQGLCAAAFQCTATPSSDHQQQRLLLKPEAPAAREYLERLGRLICMGESNLANCLLAVVIWGRRSGGSITLPRKVQSIGLDLLTRLLVNHFQATAVVGIYTVDAPACLRCSRLCLRLR